MTRDADSTVIASYAMLRRGLLLYLATAGPVSGLVVGLIVLHIAQAPQGAVLFALFMGIGAVNTYVFGFDRIYLVELTPVELRWRQALHGGVAPLSDVRSVHFSKISRRGRAFEVATVEFASRRKLKFPATKPGLAEFLAKLHETAPQVTVEPHGHSLNADLARGRAPV